MNWEEKSEWRKGAGAVFGCFVGIGLGVHALPLYGQALFVTPLQAEFGWSRLDVSFAPSIVVILLALAAPFAGVLADKVSIRALVAVSALCMSGSYLALANLNANIWSLYLPMATMAVLGAACSALSFSRVIAAHFQKHRGTALGIFMTGNGFTSFLTPLLLALVIATYGWRVGYYTLAAVMMVGAVVLAIFVRMPSQQIGTRFASSAAPRKGVSFGDAVKMPHSWLLAIIFFLIPLAIGGFITHMAAMLSDAGFSPTQAAMQVSGIGIAMMIARLTTGYPHRSILRPLHWCDLDGACCGRADRHGIWRRRLCIFWRTGNGAGDWSRDRPYRFPYGPVLRSPFIWSHLWRPVWLLDGRHGLLSHRFRYHQTAVWKLLSGIGHGVHYHGDGCNPVPFLAQLFRTKPSEPRA